MLLSELAPQGLMLFLHYPDRQLPSRVRVFVDFVIDVVRSHPDFAVDAAQFVFRPTVVGRKSLTPRQSS